MTAGAVLMTQSGPEDPPARFSSEWWLESLLGVPLRVTILLLIAILVRYILHSIIRGLVRRAESTEAPGQLLGSKRAAHVVFGTAGIYSERRAARARTLGSLGKSIVTAIIAALVAVMILGELGYNVGPLLASAGIAGVALGFGAQNLVKDFISGVMMMLEDQYGVGDVIDMGEATGTVEAVGLRTTQVRGVDGTLWHVRNGEVIRIGNFGQDWSRAVVDVGVGYGEDAARVREILLDVARTMVAELEWADLVLEEPEVWGVTELGDNAVTIRLVVKTRPLEQWGVSRELLARIKVRFDAEGIEIPFPQRTVWMRPDPGPAD